MDERARHLLLASPRLQQNIALFPYGGFLWLSHA